MNLIPCQITLDIPSLDIHQDYAAKSELWIRESGEQKQKHI